MNSSRENTAAPAGAGRIRAYLIFGALLVAAWVLWSGMFKPLLLGLGAFSCALAGYIAVRMGYFDTRVFALRFNLRVITFWGWLLQEIVKSSLEVARVVLSRDLRLSTRVVELDLQTGAVVGEMPVGNRGDGTLYGIYAGEGEAREAQESLRAAADWLRVARTHGSR